MPGEGAAGAVGGVIVINLDRRPDRWTAFQDTWRDVLDWSRVERLSAVDGRALAGALQEPWFRGRKRDATWAGRGGCALSHRDALRLARAKGWSRTLILEDDAVPQDVPRIAAALGGAMGAGVDLLYLGCGRPRGPAPAEQGVHAIEGALDLHAYVVTAHARDRLLAGLPDDAAIWPWVARERAVDRYVDRKAAVDLRVGSLWPPAVIQRLDASDITQRGGGQPADVAPLDAAPPRPAALRRLERGWLDLGDRLRAGLKAVVGF